MPNESMNLCYKYTVLGDQDLEKVPELLQRLDCVRNHNGASNLIFLFLFVNILHLCCTKL